MHDLGIFRFAPQIMAKTTNLATGVSRIGRPKLKEIGRILFNGIQQTLPLMTGYLMFVTLLPFKKTYFHDGFSNQLCDRLPERTSIYPEKTPLVTVDGASGVRT